MAEAKDRSIALEVVNDLHTQFALFARAVVVACQDGHVSLLEGVNLGLKATAMASQVITLVQGTDAAALQDVLDVLEQGQVVLPE
jgi:hypothetical protein